MKVKEFLKAQNIGKLHQYSKEKQCKLENKVLEIRLEVFSVGLY
jgi:hypothetical protein